MDYYRNEKDLTDEWLKKNDPLYFNERERKKQGIHYLTNNQMRYIYKYREVLVEDYKMDHMNHKGYELENMKRSMKKKEKIRGNKKCG